MASSQTVTLKIVLCLQILFIAAVSAAHREKFCGPKLTETLQILCKHKYNSMSKRSDDGDDNDYSNDEPIIAHPRFAYQSFPFGSYSTSEIGHVRGDWTPLAIKRGVFDDCCKNPCSHRELMSYCGY